MEKKKRCPKPVTTAEENKDYLRKIFAMFRDLETTVNAQRHEKYSNTEVRLMNEIVYSMDKGERVISTQLASRLGITRSAVSQIIAKLEGDGVVRRVPDAVDRKIAYVELTEKSSATYEAIINVYTDFVGKVVAYMGVSKMDKLLGLVDDFYTAVGNACDDYTKAQAKQEENA